jgi:putative ABC transport system ATP-binding protein
MALIRLAAAAKSYGPIFALRPTTLAIDAGEYVAIVGKSGSGKSTLLNLVAGLDNATEGSVTVEDQDLARLSEGRRAKWRGRALGVVFQFYQLLPTITVLDNILLAMSLSKAPGVKRTKARALELLETVGLGPQANRLPPTLSGGQQQRAAIARALANDPALLLMDEPTGSIDSEATRDVLALLDALNAKGRTLIVVTHDEDVAARARRRIMLRDGAVVSDEHGANR